MIYKVKARFNFERTEEFYKKLTDGTIEAQKPDGSEIINSMKRAIIDEHGFIQWTEMCFCPTPLDHERRTVYDYYFSNLETEIVENHFEITGESFFDRISTTSRT